MSLEGRYEQVAAELRQVQGEKENLHDELMMTKDMPLIVKVKAAGCHIGNCLHSVALFPLYSLQPGQ